MRRYRALAFGALLAAAATACAPRTVTHITGTGDQVKFIYNRTDFFNSETGVIQCQRQADGSLTECREIGIQYVVPGKD